MSVNVCPKCGALLDPGAVECKSCGERFTVQQNGYAQPQTQQIYVTGINPSWPVKNKLVAGILGIFFGGLGVHKFYLGKIGMGILYLCFCWTGIPELVGFIEGIIYLCSNDENFQLKNHVRIG